MLEVLLYDGSYPGFLSACLNALRRGDEEVEIRQGEEGQLVLGGYYLVEAGPDDAAKMRSWIAEQMGRKAERWAELAFRSEFQDREEALLAFFRLGLKEGRRWDRQPLPPEVERVARMARFTWREYHRWKGITRFSRPVEGGRYLAEVEPSADIIELLAAHFRKRMPTLSWEIRDLKRAKRAVHRASYHLLEETTERFLPERDRAYSLWKVYYTSIYLPERLNPRLKRSHLPARYWKFVPEYVESATKGPVVDRLDPDPGLDVKTKDRT